MIYSSQNPSSSINPDAMYRARECAAFYSIGLSTWWYWTKTGKAQRGLKIGPRTTVWPGSYLLELREQLFEHAQH